MGHGPHGYGSIKWAMGHMGHSQLFRGSWATWVMSQLFSGLWATWVMGQLFSGSWAMLVMGQLFNGSQRSHGFWVTWVICSVGHMGQL